MAFSLEQIIELAEELRAAGFDAGARQCVAAEDLMIALAARGASPGDPRGWRTLLAPIFCATPAEQEQFYQRFDLWLRRQPDWKPVEAELKAAAADAPRRRQWLRRPVMAALISLMILLAAGAWYLSRQTGYTLSGQIMSGAGGKPVAGARIEILDRQAVSGPDGKFALVYQTSNFQRLFRAGRQASFRVAHDEHEPHAASISVHQPSPQTITLSRLQARTAPGSSTITLPKVEPAPTPTPPASSDSSRLRLLLAALPLLVFAVWLLRRLLRRRAMLRRLQVAGDPQPKSIKLKGAGDLLFQGPRFRRAAQALRRHREAASTDLDVDATVRWTLGRGGLFTPRYGARRSSPEYLLLVDRAGPGDEQARYGEEMARRLEAGGVYVDRYYFQNDPLTCRRFGDPLPAVLTLADLAARHPDHRLIVFGDGAGFVSPVTGEPERWLESLAAWPRRALLTPELASGYREQALAENDLLVLPATEDGLAALARSADEPASQPNSRKPPRPFPRAILQRPRRWLERHEPRPEAADELIRQLRDYLDDGGWLWLAACAVYPALSWEVTLYFGVELLGKTEDFAARLLALVRLPWFRHGAMPDWLRLRLIESFTPEQELAVRRAIEKMLSSLDDKGEIELEIAEPEADDAPGMRERLKAKMASWRRRENLADLINNQSEESPLRDFVFLCFLSGQRPNRADRLAVGAPDMLRHALFNDGQLRLGMRTVTAAILALLLTLLLLALLRLDNWLYYLIVLTSVSVLLRAVWFWSSRIKLLKREQFPDTGHFVWSSDDDREKIVINASPPSVDQLPKQAHCNLFSYELFFCGRHFIADSGVHGREGDPFLEYCRSTRAHNTVMFDGIEQSRLKGTSGVGRPAKLISVWSDYDRDHGFFTFEGEYQRHDRKLTHHRHISRRYNEEFKTYEWMVEDAATKGRMKVAASFVHLHPSWSARALAPIEFNKQRVLCECGSTQVLIETFAEERDPDPEGSVDVTILKGEMAPIQGWTFSDFGAAEESFTIRFDFNVQIGDKFGYRIRAIKKRVVKK